MVVAAISVPQCFLYSTLHKVTIMKYLHSFIANLSIKDCNCARRICSLIPPSCPIERDISFLGHFLFHVPAMCKLNPFYDDLVTLRFRALSFLAEHHEDTSQFT